MKYFALTFLASWSAFFAAISVSSNAPLAGMLVFAGTMAPGLVALAITGRKAGPLLARLVQWRAGAQWYLFAVGFMAAIKLGVGLAHRMITGAWPTIGSQSAGLVIAAILFSTPFQSGEEIGWRGYALLRLAERIGYGRGSVALGLIWAGWHLPLFLRVPRNDECGQSFPVRALGVTALLVAFAWLYLHTGGSLLLMMLFHSAVNNIPHFVPSVVEDTRNVFSIHASLVAWLTAVFLWICAVFVLIRMRNQKAFTRV